MAKRTGLLVFGAFLSFALAMPAGAQSNDDDYTPLNSRIKRSRPFSTQLLNRWVAQTTAVSRARNRAMLNQFTGCVFNRSRSGSLELLEKTDPGFNDFGQIGLDNERALRIYGFKDCLNRVASSRGMGVQLRFSPGSLRQWLVQEAYFDRYQDGPTWIQAGHELGPRTYPLSARNPGVLGAMDFADCVVVTDPYTADFFYRTAAGSDEEKQAVEALTPALGPCIPQGQQVSLSIPALRVWLGEALWHAANHSRPGTAAGESQGSTE